MKLKKIISLALMLCLVLALMPAAFAEDYEYCIFDLDENTGTIDNYGKDDSYQYFLEIKMKKNSGEVLYNYAIIEENSSMVVYNLGTVNNNRGTVNTNSGTVYNFGGTILYNDGTVYNFGGTYNQNNKTIIEFYPVTFIYEVDAVVTGGVAIEEFISEGEPASVADPEGKLWLRENYGAVLAVPAPGCTLEISGGCRWEKQSDGSFVIYNVSGPVTIKLVPMPKSPVPATGDMSNMPLWSALFLGLAAVAIATRKKKA